MKPSLGFTLVELMITLVVASVVLAMGVPKFRQMVSNNRLVAQNNEFIAALNLARSEAIKRADRVVVCASANGTACAGSGGWEQGWIIFADTDNDAAVDTGEEVLRAHEGLPGGNTLTGNSSVALYVSYTADGFTRTTGGGLQMGSLVLCDYRGAGHGRGIVISSSGRARTGAASDLGLSSCSP